MNDYAKGYLDAMMEAQKLVNGYSFTEVLTKGIFLEELERTVPYSPHTSNAATKEYVYSRYFIDKKITSEERKSIIKRVSDNFNTKLYTVNPTPYLPNAINMGSVNAYSQLPYVFKCSKINLNISLRSIHAGIPLRAIEIMGAGGFLLSNFQRDFLDYFEPDKDFVYYEDENDLIDKCRFYLYNDNERLAIANNGYLKVKEFFSYDVMLKKILETVFS
jgi:spore maturation protein CgeB